MAGRKENFSVIAKELNYKPHLQRLPSWPSSTWWRPQQFRQGSDLACLQILLYQAGTGSDSRYGPYVQEAVCRGDRPHGARGPEVRGRGPGVQSGAQGGVRPLRGAARRGGDCTGVQCTQ